MRFRLVWSGMITLAMALGMVFAASYLDGTNFTTRGASRAASRTAQQVKLNQAALVYKLPSQIHWVDDPIGAKTAVLVGEPSKPGLYIVLVKWPPHHMSHPHWHPYDRFITVLSGIWWVGTGTKFDPERTVPMPRGSFVTDFAKGVHYDGAKNEEVVLEIVGEGPATATPAEKK